MTKLRALLALALLTGSALAQSSKGNRGGSLTPAQIPAVYGQCEVNDYALCSTSADANGFPNEVAAGTGGAVTVTGTGLSLFIGGVYQTGTGTYSNVVTGTTSSFNYLYVKADAASSTLQASDFAKTVNAPVYSYKTPTACTGATSTDPQYWFDLSSRVWRVSTAAACSFSPASPQVVFLAVFWVTAAPAVSGIAHEPLNLSPYRRFELFGDGFDANANNGGTDIVKQTLTSGTTTIDGFHTYTALELTGATLNPSAWSQNTPTQGGELILWSQNPVLIANSSTVSASALGRVGGAASTGTCNAGNAGGLGGNGGGGGGASATNPGCASGAHAYWSAWSQIAAGGTAGIVGGNGGNGTSAPPSTPVCAGTTYPPLLGSAGGSGGGDTTNNSGAGGNAGGGIVIRAPSIVEDASSTISANGGNGGAAAGGNSGGGGGGGGGIQCLQGGFVSIAGTFTATGGSSGALAGAGGAGGTGGTGLAVKYKVF